MQFGAIKCSGVFMLVDARSDGISNYILKYCLPREGGLGAWAQPTGLEIKTDKNENVPWRVKTLINVLK